MKTTELIEHLQDLLEKHGDLEVCQVSYYGDIIYMKKKHFIYTEAAGDNSKLDKPVIKLSCAIYFDEI